MAKLSGIEVYKHLPRTNCKDCGLPTCMAFAMQVASQKLGIDQCPHVSDDARAALGAAQTPPMETVSLGPKARSWLLGGETVMHRHEERFQHAPLIATRVSACLSDEDLEARIESIHTLQFERIGEMIGVDAIAVDADGVDVDRFARVVAYVASRSELQILLLCEQPELLERAAAACLDRRPLLVAATHENSQSVLQLALSMGLPIVARGCGIAEVTALASELGSSGIGQLLLDPQPEALVDAIGSLTQLRRLALEHRQSGAGYPAYVDVGSLAASSDEEAPDAMAQMTAGVSLVMKYAGVLVIDAVEAWAIHPVLAARQDIYTDPQVPNAVESKLYEIGDPGPDAPVLVTTNFALTYFSMAGEVANSKVPSFVSVIDTEGLGVLNAYADQRLTVDRLVETIRGQGVMERVHHNRVIIPGLVARMRVGIEEASGWQVIVGPDTASGIPRFLHERLAQWKDAP